MSYSRSSPPPPSYRRTPMPQTHRSTHRNRTSTRGMTDSPMYHEENIFGFPRHQDPLFADNLRPSWAPMIENRQVYQRPTYIRPEYDAPVLRQDPVRKPMYVKPMYDAPIAVKPKYTQDYEQAPAYRKPGYYQQYDRGPNYVIKNYSAPAYNKPTVDQRQINYDRPEYSKPVYDPQEYRTPREIAPPLISPAE
ncbi:MAG: hypothetical protein ACWGMZ_03220 [Thermoguttaceae bacterium]